MNPRKIIHTLALVFTLAGLALVLSNAAGTVAAGDGTEKIEGTLMDDLVSAGRSDYIIRFNEQADLSAAYSMGWEERGWYVYNTLTETAQRTQTGARAYLDAHGLTYRTFIAGNELYVYGGDLQSATSLGAMPEVLNIRAPRTYTIQPVEADAAVLRASWAGELLAKGMPATVDDVDAVEWGIDYTNADEFWTTFNVRGENIRVGNIDTGVRYTHEALYSKYACAGSASHTACWKDPDGIYSAPYDGNGHGTHTMGIMVGSDYYNLNQIGMAPNARWIACQGCDGATCEDADLLACADWMLAPGGNPSNRPHVLNNSWGGTEDGDDWFLAKVVAWRAAGIFPAFSAGNNADDVPNEPCNTLGDPGSYQESFASAAHNSSGLVAAFSSRGPSEFGHEPYTKPNIIAPGVFIRSAYMYSDIYYAVMDGTSQASPHSAGAVALLWACNPALIGQVDATFQLLQDTARTPPAASCGVPPDGEGNYDYGYGYLDVLAAGYVTCVATLDGVVTDGSGNPLANVVVTATNQADSTQTKYTTLADGRYLMYLKPGVYDVSAVLYAYSSGVRTDLSLSAGQTAHLNFTLVYEGGWRLVDPATCFDFWRHDAEYYPGDGNIYIMGGRDGPDGTTTYGDIYAFNPVSGDCWDTGDDMPVPVSNYTISLVTYGADNLLCTFGGRDAAGNATRAVQCYNPLEGTFAEDVQDLPSDYSACFPGGQEVVNNQVYIIGGINPVATSPCNYDLTWRYDPELNTYEQLGDLSMTRGNIFTAVVDGRIYAFGGDIFDGVTLLPQVRTEVMADPGGAGTWDNTAVAELPAALGAGRAFGFDLDSTFGLAGEVVLVGGGVFPSETAAVFTYNTVTNVYDQAFVDLQEARRNFAAAFVPFSTGDPWDGLPGLYVFGGRQVTDNPPYAPAEYFSLRQVVYTFFPTIIKAEP